MNEKGFTLVELMAVFVVLGVLMGVTIANIVGITTANKQQAYAEDAKKFSNDVEYRFRGDSTIEKPKYNGECLIANLKYVAGSEFDEPPYGGVYDMDNSYVVMLKKDNEYKYYVQLIERIDGEGFRGIRLDNVNSLTGDKYQNEIDEATVIGDFAKGLGEIKSKSPTELPAYYTTLAGQIKAEDTTTALCTKILHVYYEE